MADPTERADESAGQGSDPEQGSPSGNYTIDELAALTSVPSRTIRFYQAKGALPPPVRRGRVAYYDESHAERLKLVAHLQDRGLSLRAIRDLFQHAEGGDVSVSEWLGVGEQLREPWSEDRPRVCTEAELEQLLSGAIRPGLVGDLIRVGLSRREGGSPPTYFLASPALVQMASRSKRRARWDSPRGATSCRNNSGERPMIVGHFVRVVREKSAGTGQLARSVLRKINWMRFGVFAQEVERALRRPSNRARSFRRRGRGER